MNTKIITLSAITIIILFTGIIFFNNTSKIKQQVITPNTNEIVSPTPTSKYFKAQYLGFSIKAPFNYKVEDGMTSVLVSSGSKKIIIARNGTGFPNLEDYLSAFDNRNKWNIIEEKKVPISDYQVIMRVFYRTSDSLVKEKIYFIYKDYVVFVISTDSEELFTDLDNIAQSFNILLK